MGSIEGSSMGKAFVSLALGSLLKAPLAQGTAFLDSSWEVASSFATCLNSICKVLKQSSIGARASQIRLDIERENERPQME